MMRMGLIVVGLGTLAVMELGTPSRTKTSAPDPFEQIAVDLSSVSRDTLQKVDRLETHYLQNKLPVQPISSVVPALPPPEVKAIISEQGSGAVGRSTDKREVVRKPKPKPKHTTPDKPQPKVTNANRAPKPERSKAIVEVKPCRPNAFDSLLQAFNLSSRCQS